MIKMPRGGKRSPPGGRPKGSKKEIRRDVSKSIRFTKGEYKEIKKASKKQSITETSFIRKASLKEAERINYEFRQGKRS